MLAAMNAAETAAYQLAVIGVGQDPLAEITAMVVQECRGHIGDSTRNTLAAGNKLPERVFYHALAMIRFRMLTRLDLEVSEDRRKEQRDALAFFYRVAEGKVDIEQPEGAIDDSGSTGGGSVETVSGRERIATRTKLSGL